MRAHPTLAAPPIFRLAGRDGPRLDLASDTAATAHIFVLADDIMRVLVLPEGRLKGPNSWAIAPWQDDCPAEGRSRFDVSGFHPPDILLEEADRRLTITTSRLSLSVRLDGLFLSWRQRGTDGEWQAIAQDRPTQAYDFGWWDGRAHHYLARKPGERYFGLGERAGPTDRAGGRYRLSNLDAMGYDAASTDPLYKHIPFYITHRDGPAGAFGLFYDTLADCTFDFGRELDNYHGHYRGFVAEHGDLDYWLIAGPRVVDVVRRFTRLTGRPALPPRWALGYSGSTMSYTDAPDAQAQMEGFLEGCEAHDILCDSFHLSSGYTSIGPKRYVFHWNRDKFPDPAGFVARYAAAGVRLVPNIKPALLRDHPRFEEAHARGLLIADPDGEPAWIQFWDEVGAYLDFTNPAAADWWKARVTESLLDVGMAATWNDNNEFEVISPRATAHGFGRPHPARETKPLQTLAMIRASRDAQLAHAPDRRPFLVSRSGAVGMHRYVQTWSGDNYTRWETLRFNLKMGLGLALSGVSNTGHDVGGFSGPAPDAELLVRWVQFGLLMPRFSIHSWNDDATANEPWMHPRATPYVRDLIKLRYRFLPQIYRLLFTYAELCDPVMRPTFLDFPDDPACLSDDDSWMLGPDLLVAPVVEPGQAERSVWLPAGADWLDYWSGQRHAGSRRITLSAPWDKPILLQRAGSGLALNIAPQTFAHRADTRAMLIAPLDEGAFQAISIEDDGESQAWRRGGTALWRLRVICSAETITVAPSLEGHYPAARRLVLLLPAGETRPLTVEGAHAEPETTFEGWRAVAVRV
ncbi:TIM-barrel domain-containing protein [Caulobacter sp. KR2-114]|uniref:glycoside hydrolase family 31 protein n=1 Tax=Caulobacter sp. KR2-114 TaxID=3400912 RepID=UPI003C0750B3